MENSLRPYYDSQARYVVVDVETTGFSPVHDRVVEIACATIEGGAVVDTWSSLVDPGRPIPQRVSAVHGITDRDVVGALHFAFAQRIVRNRCRDATVVAHNARFDRSFLPELEARPWLCTMKLARLAFPEAPNYRNQTLRSYLGLDTDPRLARCGAHRALDDVMVTSAVMLRCLEKLSR